MSPVCSENGTPSPVPLDPVDCSLNRDFSLLCGDVVASSKSGRGQAADPVHFSTYGRMHRPDHEVTCCMTLTLLFTQHPDESASVPAGLDLRCRSACA